MINEAPLILKGAFVRFYEILSYKSSQHVDIWVQKLKNGEISIR